MKSNLNLAWAISFLILVLVILFAPFFFQGKTFLPSDEHYMAYKPFATETSVFEPYNHFDDDVLRWYYEWKHYQKKYPYQPYWSPNIFGGVPWYANPYASHFSSTNWILQLGPLTQMYQLQLILQLFIGGVAMLLLVRSLGVPVLGQLLFASSYMLCSMFITLLLRWWLLGSFCWAPLILLSLRKFWRTPSLQWFACSALFMALSFTDGFIQASAFTLMMVAVFSFFSWIYISKGIGFFRFSWFCIALVIFAVALSAIMWFPTMEYFLLDMAKGSSRAEGNVFGKNMIQRILTLPLLVSFFMPQLLGSVRALDVAKLINSHIQDFAGYYGAPALFFAFLGLLGFKKIPRDIKPFWFLALFGLIVPIFTPLDRYVYFRFLIVYVVAAIPLGAAVYLSFAQESAEQFIYRRYVKYFFGICASIFVAVLGLNLVFLFKKPELYQRLHDYIAPRVNLSVLGVHNQEWMLSRVGKTFEHYSILSVTMWAPLLLLAILLATIVAWGKRKLNANGATIIFIVIANIELFMFARAWHGFHDLQQYPLFPKNQVVDFLTKNLGPYRAYMNDSNGSTPQKPQRQILPVDTQIIYGFKTVEGFDGLSPAVLYHIPVEPWEYHKWADLNVKYMVTNANPKITNELLQERFTDGNVTIYELKNPQSRGRVFFDYRPEEMKTLMAKFSTGLNFEGAPLVEEKDLNSFQRSSVTPVEATIAAEDDNFIEYKFNSPREGLFVASETWYPGWKAFLDGKEVSVHKANYIMRMVQVPAGEHTLTFKFEPGSYQWGRNITLFALVGFVVLLAAGLRTSKNEGEFA